MKLGIALAGGVLVGSMVVACSGGTATTATDQPAVTTTSVATVQTDTPDSTVGPSAATTVRFVAEDGVELEGVRFGNGPVWVVLAHMRPATMDSWFDFAEDLSDAGYSALAFNYRGYGDSDGSGFAVAVDTVAAIDFAYSSGAGSVVVIGASMGGTGAIAAATQRLVAGIATLSAPGSFEGVDAVAAVGRVTAPALFVAASDDQPYADAIADFAAAASGPINTVFFDGTAHGTDLFASHGVELHDQLLAFIRSATE